MPWGSTPQQEAEGEQVQGRGEAGTGALVIPRGSSGACLASSGLSHAFLEPLGLQAVLEYGCCWVTMCLDGLAAQATLAGKF